MSACLRAFVGLLHATDACVSTLLALTTARNTYTTGGFCTITHTDLPQVHDQCFLYYVHNVNAASIKPLVFTEGGEYLPQLEKLDPDKQHDVLYSNAHQIHDFTRREIFLRTEHHTLYVVYSETR